MNIFSRYPFSFLFAWIITGCFIISCFSSGCSGSQKMSEEEYYAYLRNDTTICSIPEIEPSHFILTSIDTILSKRAQFENCSNDPNPFVYSIRSTLTNDTLIHVIEELFSTLNLEYYFHGAFIHEGNIFVVSKEDIADSSYKHLENESIIEIPFCDRIYHPKYRYVSRIINDGICVECIKNEVITIE